MQSKQCYDGSKAKPEKYHLLITSYNPKRFQIKIGSEANTNSKFEKLMGVKIDHELNFKEHVTSLCYEFHDP